MRLRSSRDVVAVLREGRRSRHPLLHLATLPNQLGHNRFAYAVGKRIDRRAVIRNQIRRRLREVARAAPLRQGYDIVIVAGPATVAASFSELAAAFEACARRSGIWPAESS